MEYCSVSGVMSMVLVIWMEVIYLVVVNVLVEQVMRVVIE